VTRAEHTLHISLSSLPSPILGIILRTKFGVRAATLYIGTISPHPLRSIHITEHMSGEFLGRWQPQTVWSVMTVAVMKMKKKETEEEEEELQQRLRKQALHLKHLAPWLM
jgi:hypothetical protein